MKKGTLAALGTVNFFWEKSNLLSTFVRLGSSCKCSITSLVFNLTPRLYKTRNWVHYTFLTLLQQNMMNICSADLRVKKTINFYKNIGLTGNPTV